MEEFEVKEYRSGYTRVRYALGFVPKQVFGDNPERYVIRAVRGSLMVSSRATSLVGPLSGQRRRA